MPGVVAAHQPLQLGEFADHRGEQVALRQLRRAVRHDRVAADRRRDLDGERAHALHLVVQRAELVLERHFAQRIAPVLEPMPAIGGPEEVGVRQARPHHSFVAGDHLRGIGALDIGDGDEPRHQRRIRPAHREVALVILHRRDQHFGWQVEVLHVETAGERYRPFDQRRHFVEQAFLDDRMAAEPLRGRSHALADGFTALVYVDQHLAALVQRLHVCGRVCDAQRLRRHEPVAVGDVGRGHAENRGIDDVLAEQHQHPVHRAHELRVAVAPAHPPGDGQRVERTLHDGRQQADGERPSLGAAVHHPRALRRLQLLERVDFDAATLRERKRSLGRRALGIECRLQRRTAPFERPVGLTLDQLAHPDREAAWRGEMLDALVRQAGPGEPLRDPVRERGGEGQQRLRRQFFGADLDQEVPGCAHASPSVGSLIVPSTRSAPEPSRTIGKPSAARLA